MVWLLIIEVLLLLMAILFFTLKLSWLSSFAIVMMIFFPTCYMSCALYGVIEDNIAPGIVYGKERAKAEDIKLINRKGGKYTFSNGETVKVPKSNALIIYPGLGFFLGGAIVVFPGIFLALQITRRYAPDVYKYFVPSSVQDKNIIETK